MRFAVYQMSRQGGREKNEDRLGYCYTRDAGLFVVADGMGGHPEGEVAAQLALQALVTQFQRDSQPALADPQQFLHQAILIAHQQLLQYAARRGLGDSPRTTIVACVLQAGVAHWAHCGDSRLYLVRQQGLLTRTRDHSYAEMRQSLGPSAMPGGQAGLNRNVLFTCLGSPGKPVIDSSGPVALHTGDRLLLCSDGLWDNVDDHLITQGLAAMPVDQSVPALVERALRLGGARCDNVSALGLEWQHEHGAQDPPPSVHPSGDSSLPSTQPAFATTVPAPADGAAAASPAGMSEAEISREVEAIRQAIRQSAPRRARLINR